MVACHKNAADSDFPTEANIVHFINCSHSCMSGRKFVFLLLLFFGSVIFGFFLLLSFSFNLFYCFRFFVRRLRQSHPEDPAAVSLNTRGILQLGATLYSFDSVEKSHHKLIAKVW